MLLSGFAHAALADDGDDDDDDRDERRAPIVKFEDNKERYKYEYRDHRCRYKYEYKYRSGKTKVEQKGSRVGEGRERAVTTVSGAVIGAVVGGAIGRSMDEVDQACTGQALEYANLNQSVAWKNAARGTSYVVTPVESMRSERGAECRKYVLRTISGAARQEQTGRACRRGDGAWVPQA